MNSPVRDPSRTDAPGVRRFVVVWQNPETREFLHVGHLEADESSDSPQYRFAYESDGKTHPAFRPFSAFPDLHAVYTSDHLFSFFGNRVMSSRRPDFDQYIEALDLDLEEASPLEVLARSGGERATDTVQVVPDARRIDDRTEERLFLVSGCRHIDDIESRLACLGAGDELLVRPRPANEWDPRALALTMNTVDEQEVGYIPGYLLSQVHKELESGADVRVVVERINGPEVPWHLRLLCKLTIRSA